MITTAIAVLVKTPGLSPIKTRLAQSTIKPSNPISTSNTAAANFYELAIAALEYTLTELSTNASVASPITAYWGVAEHRGLDHPLWARLDRLYGGKGNLGDCQHRLYQLLLECYQRVLLLGSDSPQLSPQHLTKAIRALDNHHYCIGPSDDGGYYCIGGCRDIPHSVWTNVQYSSEKTAQQLIDRLPSVPAILRPLCDVDRPQDLSVLVRQMPGRPSPPQQQIIDWVSGLAG